jgi:5'-3' exonuclease
LIPAVLVDASIYLFRAWHAWPERLDRDGQPVHALHGFLAFLAELIERTHPRHLALAFDADPDGGFRRRIDPRYKAHRPPTPPALLRQRELAREAAGLLGLRTLAIADFEADDLIGSASAVFAREGLPSLLISADKDLGQLLGPCDRLWDFDRQRPFGPEGVRERFGVEPAQIADYLALAGDASDNIRGVPGIGARTAARLLQAFGDLERLLAELPALARLSMRGARRLPDVLNAHRAELMRNRLLTAIRRDAPVPTEASAYRPRSGDTVGLEAFAERHSLPHRLLLRLIAAIERGTGPLSGP